MAPADRRDLLDLVVEPDRRPVELDEQDGARLGREPGAKGRLDGAEDEAIHHLERRGDDAGGDDAGVRLARGGDRSEDGEQRPVRLRRADETQRRARDDPERAFRADDDPEEVVTRPVLDGAPDLHDLPGRQHELDGENVVRRHAVLEGMRSARVLGDVASDRARGLARGIGREDQARLLDRARDPQVHDSGLRGHAAIPDVDRLDALQPARADHHRRPDRKGSSREAGTRSARDEGDAVLREHPDDRAHLLGSSRQYDELGSRAFEGVAVTLVGQERVAPCDDAPRPDDLFEAALQPRARHGHSLVHRLRNSLAQIAVDRRPWQGGPTQEYQGIFRGGPTQPGASRGGEMCQGISETVH